ncbi:MAG: hypothetical protein NZ959_07460 [Armatimonadetes bacterium]|nr:hypothetical protein [Armatimonadota bacterium]MDW8122224.1 hypothetical protein [Armatimonadota bacterium]
MEAIESLGSQLEYLEESIEMALEATRDAIIRGTALQVRALKKIQNRMVQGFRDLEAAFQFGLTQIAGQQEQSNKILTDVLAVLKAPRKTEADEMRERGDEAYRNGVTARRVEDREQWMNLALRAYGDCIEKNPSDFSALFSIGTILFYERGASEGALASFRLAATFSEPYSAYHAALAWLQIAYIRRCRKEQEHAYEATREAVRLQPEWAETHFQHAISCALTSRESEMKESLKTAIRLDRNYWFRACTEPELWVGSEMIRHTVRETLEELRQEASQKASNEIASAEVAVADLDRLIEAVYELSLPTDQATDYRREALTALQQARHLYAQQTYFDLLDAHWILGGSAVFGGLALQSWFAFFVTPVVIWIFVFAIIAAGLQAHKDDCQSCQNRYEAKKQELEREREEELATARHALLQDYAHRQVQLEMQMDREVTRKRQVLARLFPSDHSLPALPESAT